MLQALNILQNALLTKKWSCSNNLVNYVLKQCKEKLSLNEIIEISEIASFELANDNPFKTFMGVE